MQDFILSHIAEFIAGIAMLFATGAYKRLEKKIAEKDKNAEEKDKKTEAAFKGIQALLHHQLYQDCQRLLEEKCVTPTELCDIEKIYESYHALGGNGTGTALYNRILSLPIDIDNGKDDDND